MEGARGKKSSRRGLMERIVPMLRSPSLLRGAVKNAWLARSCSAFPQGYEVKERREVKMLARKTLSKEDAIISAAEFRNLSFEGSQAGNVTYTRGPEEFLPDELVEKILAMLPFPHVFKVRALSKSWLARFSPIESQDDEEKKHRATSFQKEVCQWSFNWKTLCPVFIDSRKGFTAYDRASGRWARMPSLSFIPFHLLNNPYLQMDGALLLMSEFYESKSGSRGSSRHELCVANILTQSLRHLPRPPPVLCTPMENCTLYFQKLVSQTSLGTYKVVVLYISRARGYYIIQIYDSKSNAWRSTTLAKKLPGTVSPPAYLNGVLYMAVEENPRDLLALNVEQGTFEELEILGDVVGKIAAGLVTCNDHLLMLVKETRFDRVGGQVLKIDLGLRRFLEVARAPAPQHCINTLLSDGNCLLFPFCEGRKFYDGMVVYNVEENTRNSIRFHWKVKSGFPKHRGVFTFQPNLNPFMAV